MSPFFKTAIAASAFGPTQSSANATGIFKMRATSAATGRSESFALGPLGLAKCDSRITLPPLSAISVMVGTISLMRVASATLPSCIGTLRSTRTRTRFPFKSASSRLRNDMVGEALSDEGLSDEDLAGEGISVGDTTDRDMA